MSASKLKPQTSMRIGPRFRYRDSPFINPTQRDDVPVEPNTTPSNNSCIWFAGFASKTNVEQQEDKVPVNPTISCC